MDIILPRKRDRYINRIGFIKTKSEDVALWVIDGFKSKPLRDSLPNLRIAKNKKMNTPNQGIRQNIDNKKIDNKECQ